MTKEQREKFADIVRRCQMAGDQQPIVSGWQGREAVLAAAARLQALEAAAAGFDPVLSQPRPFETVLVHIRGWERALGIWDGHVWIVQTVEFESSQVFRWWRLPGASLDGDTAGKDT